MEQTKLISIVKEAIRQRQQQVEDIMRENNSTFERYKDLLSQLEADSNSITNISLEEIAEILSETNLSEAEREIEFSYLKSVKSLLDLNRTKKTTFQLSEKQIAYLITLTHQLQEIVEIYKQKSREKLESASEITSKMRELKSLLGILEDPKCRQFLRQTDLVLEVLQEQSV